MTDGIWHVYLLICADGSYYCCIAKDLQKRLRQHNGLCAGGARCTRARRPVRLLASMAMPSHSAALRMEARVKKLPKHQKPLAFVEAA